MYQRLAFWFDYFEKIGLIEPKRSKSIGKNRPTETERKTMSTKFPRAETLASELKKTNVGSRADKAKKRRKQRKDKELRDAVDKILDSLMRRMNKRDAKHSEPILAMKEAHPGQTRESSQLRGVSAAVYKLLQDSAEESGWHPVLRYDHKKYHSDLYVEYK